MSGLDGGWGSAPGNQCVASQCQWFSNRYPQPQPLSRVSNSYLLFPFGYFHLKSSGCLKCSMFKTDSIFFFFVPTRTFSSSPSLLNSRAFPAQSAVLKISTHPFLFHISTAPHFSLTLSFFTQTTLMVFWLVFLALSLSLLYFLLPTTAKVNFLNTNLIILP